jgi:hypothetical protein
MPKVICGACKRLVKIDGFCSNCGTPLFGESDQSREQEIELLKEIRDGLKGPSGPPPPSSPMPTPIPPGVLEIYLQYKRLGVDALVSILDSVESIYESIYWINQATENSIYDPDYETKTKALLRGNPMDRLEILYICTEESLRLRVKTGWSPSVSVEGSDVYLDVPKGVLVLITAASILITGASKSLDISTGILDYQIKEIDLKLKQHELEKLEKEKLEKKRELIEKLNKTTGSSKEQLEVALNTFLNSTTGNAEITGVQIKMESPRA